ncbi:MAG: hypothetical protein KDB14_21020 [Planctomycetales bacterium]|nr:hypothetical protein [Planctomycetales bacterium]
MTRQHPLIRLPLLVAGLVLLLAPQAAVRGDDLLAGAAKVDISHPEKEQHDPLFAKALVLHQGETTVAIVTVDAVAIGEIGSIRNDFLPNVRAAVESELGIPSLNVMINASHCHGIVCPDVEARTIKAIRMAAKRLTPVKMGSGAGHEDRIMENRRLKLKSGKEADVRHAYALPPDEEIESVGPIDPQIGILRLDRRDNGHTVAVLYNFAMHPIQSVPGNLNTADVSGIASTVIEDNLDDGAVALFVQGCAGDINPISYKAVDHPRSAVPLGNMLGLSALKAVRKVGTKADDRLKLINETIALPRANLAERIVALESERERLLTSLSGTSLNLKTFLPLVVKYNLAEDFPSYYSHRYLHEEQLGRQDMQHLDAENRQNLKRYIQNIHTMEQLTRLQTNLRLLRKHQAELVDGGKRTIDTEVVGLRVGDFVLVTFPGELTVRIGLGIKQRSPHPNTFVAGYTNGYIYYAPTAEQLKNVGNAQEDSDCVLAPEWQSQFEAKVADVLERL